MVGWEVEVEEARLHPLRFAAHDLPLRVGIVLVEEAEVEAAAVPAQAPRKPAPGVEAAGSDARRSARTRR